MSASISNDHNTSGSESLAFLFYPRFQGSYIMNGIFIDISPHLTTSSNPHIVSIT